MGAGASAEEKAQHDAEVAAMKRKMETLEAALKQKKKEVESQKRVVSAQKKVNTELRKGMTKEGRKKKADIFNHGSGGAIVSGLGLGTKKPAKGEDVANWGGVDAESSNLAKWGEDEIVGNSATVAVMQSANSWSLPTGASTAEIRRVKTAEEIAQEIENTREAQRILKEREEKSRLKQETKKKLEAGMTAINAFKANTGERMLSSKSRLKSRIERRKTIKMLKESGAAVDAPPPPLPTRPKVVDSRILDLTFQEKTLGIHFEEMSNEPPYSLFVWSVVQGWEGQRKGVCADDILIQINDTKLDNLGFDAVMDMLLSAPRPLRLKLRRDNFEGWTKVEDLPPPALPSRNNKDNNNDAPPEVPPKLPPKKKKVNSTRQPDALLSPTATPG